ncbi:MAG: hypothetical protein JWN52_1527 [Actinomycetia bacterium]|nr:hypothetical protein [Actinomycetes bacterium]
MAPIVSARPDHHIRPMGVTRSDLRMVGSKEPPGGPTRHYACPSSYDRQLREGPPLIGRGSGEAMQLAYQGQGFVLIQASEGPTVPTHSHN